MICRYDSPIGPFTLISDGTALTGLRCQPELRSQKVEESKSQSVEELKSQRVEGLKSQRVEELRSQKVEESKSQSVEESKSTKHLTLNTKHLTLNTQHLTLNTKHLTLNTQHLTLFSDLGDVSASRCLDLVCRWLDCYFSGHCPDFLPPLALQGTPFQRRVWRALMDIPYGATTTYGALARSVGCRSAQAVGQAVGRNPVAIIVPCHRVVGSDGTLTGYAYGLERKEYLLKLESTVS